MGSEMCIRDSLLLFLGLLPLVAKPKIAVVNMDVIFNGYHRKLSIEKEVQEKIAALTNSPRVLAVQEMDAKLKELAVTVRDKKLTPETRELAAEEFNSLAIEHQSLIQEMEEYLEQEKRAETQRLVETLEDILQIVHTEIAKIGKEQDFDLIIELEGKTSTQVSPIIYLREKNDITDLILKSLNEQSPENFNASPQVTE